MTIHEAIAELKDSIQGDGYQCRKETYEMAIRSLEAWDKYAEDLDDVYEDEKGGRYFIREWIEKGGSE